MLKLFDFGCSERTCHDVGPVGEGHATQRRQHDISHIHGRLLVEIRLKDAAMLKKKSPDILYRRLRPSIDLDPNVRRYMLTCQ